MLFDVTISRRSFVFGQSRAKVFTNVGSLAVAAFDLILLSVCLPVVLVR